MKAIEQYFHMVLFIMLYKVVLIFKTVDETLVCNHSNEKLLSSTSMSVNFSTLTIYTCEILKFDF